MMACSTRARSSATSNGNTACTNCRAADPVAGPARIGVVHASGRTESKRAYLGALGSAQFRWSDFVHEDTTVRPLGDTALYYGLLHARKEEAGNTRDLLFRFVSVWVRLGATWKLAFMQNNKPVGGARS